MRLVFLLLQLFSIINYSFSLNFKQFLCDTFKICEREPTIYEICDIFNLDKSTYSFCLVPITTQQPTIPSTTKYLEKYEVLNNMYNCTFNKNDETMLKEFFGASSVLSYSQPIIPYTEAPPNISNSNNLKINSFLFVGLTIIFTYIL